MSRVIQHPALARFACLGDKCEDTCCKGWSMQLDEPTLARYKAEAPELLDAVEPSAEAPWIMRKDPKTSHCVKLENGLCGIHKRYGDRMLGDACHFYPRASKMLGDETVMTATLSCPEIARLTLFDDNGFAFAEAEVARLPHSMKQYLPEGISAEEALEVHQAFLRATDDAAHVEIIFARIASAARSLELVDKNMWPRAAPFYLANADARLPQAESNIADPFNLLHALAGLVVASHKPRTERLQQTISDMEKALHATIDWQNVLIATDEKSMAAYASMQTQWRAQAEIFQPVLKRYLQMQLSLALFPFGGLGGNMNERITLIGVRLATIKLALMSATGIYSELPREMTVRIVQSLSRFLDHLGDSAFSLQIYEETGWTREARMRGLLGE